MKESVLDHGYVEFLQQDSETPSDLTVVNAARVSFAKTSTSLDEKDVKLLSYLQTHNHWTPFAHPRIAFRFKLLLDNEILHFLASTPDRGFYTTYSKSYHDSLSGTREIVISGTLYGWLNSCRYLPEYYSNQVLVSLQERFPKIIELFCPGLKQTSSSKLSFVTDFSGCEELMPITFRIKAPISIRTQLFKHKMGFVENEVSRRYVDYVPEYYDPENHQGFRGRPPKSMKQGSSEEVIAIQNVLWDVQSNMSNTFYHPYKYPTSFCIEGYNNLLKQGVAPEQARFVLPQGCYTEWWWSGTLSAYSRFFKLRTDPHAQWETRQYAEKIGNIIRTVYPNQNLI